MNCKLVAVKTEFRSTPETIEMPKYKALNLAI